MLFVALVFGELASHYPVAGALYQYSKFSVGPGYGCLHGALVMCVRGDLFDSSILARPAMP